VQIIHRRFAFNSKRHAKRLSDFVSEHTRQLFMALDISQQFLTKSTDLWDSDKDYIVGQQKVKGLKVVKDAAERGASMIQAFSGVLTCQEEQKQFLLQVIEKQT
jgi:hypothetical protein